MTNYQIVQTVGVMSVGKSSEKRLTVTQWYGRPASLDVRVWRRQDNAELTPARGLTLTDDEAHRLMELLRQYFSDQKEGRH